MRLQAPEINLSPWQKKVFEVCVGWPFLALILVAISPVIAVLGVIKLKRIVRGSPSREWSKCFAWHPVKAQVGRDDYAWPIYEWRWLEVLEYRSFGLADDSEFRVLENEWQEAE